MIGIARAMLLSALALAGCPSSPGPADSAGLGRDAFGTYQTLPDGQRALCAQSDFGPSHGGEPTCGAVTPTMRAGVACTAAQECCFTTGQCFDPVASPADCPRPVYAS